MIDIEQSMIRIRLYREGGGDTLNRPIIKKGEKKKRKKRKGKKNTKKRRKRKREDACTIADEQPLTPGVLDFKKVLGYKSP
jgi:hypothetical protein